MRERETRWSKNLIRRGIVAVELLGFLLAIAVCWLTELLDPPFSIRQVAIETVVLAGLAALVVAVTLRLIRRVRYLEGFLLVCAWCKRVRLDDRWVGIERILADKSELQLTHGICPDCADVVTGAHAER